MLGGCFVFHVCAVQTPPLPAHAPVEASRRPLGRDCLSHPCKFSLKTPPPIAVRTNAHVQKHLLPYCEVGEVKTTVILKEV